MDRSTRAILLGTTTAEGFLATFIASAVNLALPRIAKEFDLSVVMIGWIPLTYVLACAALLLPMGRVADIRGRKAVNLAGAVGFSVFALASAFAPSAPVLLVLRVCHGISAALLFSTTTAMLILSYPAENRGRALGIQVAGVYLGFTLGPVLGGIITERLGWRALFVFVGALSLANTVLIVWRLRGVEWREPRTAPFDVRGSGALIIALSALLMGFSYLPAALGIALVAAGAIGLGLFAWWEGRVPNPILDVGLMRHNRVFAFANAAVFINYAATFAMTILLSLYLQNNRGLGEETAGLVLATGTFLQAFASLFAGRLADRFNSRMMASVGMALCALALLAFAFLAAASPYWYIVATVCLLGLGIAFFASPITHTIMGSVERRHVGLAGALLPTMRVSGQSFSASIATLVMALVLGRHPLRPADYPDFLTSARICFAIFFALSVIGLLTLLAGPRRSPAPESAQRPDPAAAE